MIMQSRVVGASICSHTCTAPWILGGGVLLVRPLNTLGLLATMLPAAVVGHLSLSVMMMSFDVYKNFHGKGILEVIPFYLVNDFYFI